METLNLPKNIQNFPVIGAGYAVSYHMTHNGKQLLHFHTTPSGECQYRYCSPRMEMQILKPYNPESIKLAPYWREAWINPMGTDGKRLCLKVLIQEKNISSIQWMHVPRNTETFIDKDGFKVRKTYYPTWSFGMLTVTEIFDGYRKAYTLKSSK